MTKVVHLDTVRGCAADHDRMVAALAAYEAEPRAAVGLYSALRKAADRCGYPGQVSLLIWARARRKSYLSMIDRSHRELATGIAVNSREELAAAIDALTDGGAA